MFKLPEINSNKVKEEICYFIRNKVSKADSQGIIIGLSGGIDSSITGYLSVEAISKENVFGIHMYSSTTPQEDTNHARLMAKLLEIEYKEINIDSILKEFINIADIDNISRFNENNIQISNGNLKARIRMSLLYYYANLKNAIVVGTGNKSELNIGYFTKYGDGGCDMEPLGNIYKTQLRKLAYDWNIPKEIISKPPRAGLWPDQTDEKEIGLTYEVLDNILYMAIDKNMTNKEIMNNINITNDEINRIRTKVLNSQHKIQIPDRPKISEN